MVKHRTSNEAQEYALKAPIEADGITMSRPAGGGSIIIQKGSQCCAKITLKKGGTAIAGDRVKGHGENDKIEQHGSKIGGEVVAEEECIVDHGDRVEKS